jgi:hypothetical protein
VVEIPRLEVRFALGDKNSYTYTFLFMVIARIDIYVDLNEVAKI